MIIRELLKSQNRNNFTILLVALLLMSISAACGQISISTSSPETGTQEPLATETPSPSSTQKPTLTPTTTPIPTSSLGVELRDLLGSTVKFWHVWSGEPGMVIQELVTEFNSNNEWGITVEPTYQGGFDAMYEEVTEALETGDYPDLIVAYNYQALALNSDRDILIELNDYVEDSVWGLSDEEQEDFFPVFWKQDVLGEKQLAIPAQRSAQLIYYNTTWAQELGFDTQPTTAKQLKDQACAAARANIDDDLPENDNTGGLIISTHYSPILGWMYAFGSDIVDLDEGVYQFDQLEVQDAFTFLREMYDDGCAWLPDSQSSENEFATRRGLFSTGSVANIPYQESAFADVGSTDEWTVIPFPSPKEEPAIDVYGPSYEIFESNPENQLASWLFTKWILHPENQARLAQVSAFYPTRASALNHLESFQSTYPQWEKAVELISVAVPEPSYKSWRIVRWAVSDAATQLFRYYFSIDQVPTLVELLEETADELHKGETD